MEFTEKLKEWMQTDCVLPVDIPNIDLYMDQVTTFLEEQLQDTKRYEEDKIFTKTMINNYSKNHLLPPSIKKKYSKNHMILLIYIYYLKNFLSISDIQHVLSPLTNMFYEDEKDMTFYDIYQKIFHMEHGCTELIQQSILETHQHAKETFEDLPEGREKELLEQFSFITLLGYDIYLRKQVIEQMIDHMYHDPKEKKESHTSKKKK